MNKRNTLFICERRKLMTFICERRKLTPFIYERRKLHVCEQSLRQHASLASAMLNVCLSIIASTTSLQANRMTIFKHERNPCSFNHLSNIKNA
jgi:hypothetical protein